MFALGLTELFKQFVADKPHEEDHPLIYSDRLISLASLLTVAISFYHSGARYFYVTYKAQDISHSGAWILFDSVVFLIEAGVFFALSRALSPERFRNYCAYASFLFAIDIVWGLVTIYFHTKIPRDWIWYGLVYCFMYGVLYIALSPVNIIFKHFPLLFMNETAERRVRMRLMLASSVFVVATTAYGYYIEWDFLFPDG